MALVNGLDVDNLMKVVGAVKRNWEKGKTVWKATPTIIATSPVGVNLSRPAIKATLEA